MMSDCKEPNMSFKEGYKQGKEEQAKITAEIEHELSASCNMLSEANEMLREKLVSMETEFARMRAQLDIVYLIFGGKQ